jgi:GDSL-like Lipase/Acylhydrolase
MFQELALYVSLSGGVADPNALYFVWGGANDLLTRDSPVAGAQNIAGYVAELAMDGATHFLVPNLPNLGLTPFVQSLGPAGVAAAQGFSLAFNATLAAQLDSLRQQFPNRDITEFDIYSSSIMSSPTRAISDSQMRRTHVCPLSWYLVPIRTSMSSGMSFIRPPGRMRLLAQRSLLALFPSLAAQSCLLRV